MTEPTNNEVKEKKKGRWATKTYSKQIIDYANQSLKEDEKQIYETLFNEMSEKHKLESAEDLMLLDNLVFDFLRIKRIQGIIMKEGDVTKFKLRNGQTVTKASEASYLLNAIESQFRNTMKELMMTRKEVAKANIGLGSTDFATFLSKTAVDAEFKEVKNGKV